MRKAAQDVPVLRPLAKGIFVVPGSATDPTSTGVSEPICQSVALRSSVAFASLASSELCERSVSRSIEIQSGAVGHSHPAPSVPPDPDDRRSLLEELQSRIRAIEHGFSAATPQSVGGSISVPHGAEEDGMPPGMSLHSQPVHSAPTYPCHASAGSWSSAELPASSDTGAWTLGEPAFDAVLPRAILDPAAVHELKPATYADWPATLGFATCLAIRRCQSHCKSENDRPGKQGLANLLPERAPRSVLWCVSSSFIAEHGGLHGSGLAFLGFDPERLIAVEAAREADVLWALEEGLKSRALSLAIGVVGQIGLTPSRRLGLAAAASRTPLLLLTMPSGMAAPTAGLRLRVQRRPSAPQPFDARAPGVARFGLTLERCRGAAPEVEGWSWELEWCDDAHRFRVAAGLADREDAAAGARHRADG